MVANLPVQRLTVGALVIRLGLTQLRPHPELDARAITGVALHEAGAVMPEVEGFVVLGAGLAHGLDVVEALHGYAAAGVAALIVRESLVVDDAVARAAEASGVALLGAAADVDWIQLASFLVQSPEPVGFGLEGDAAASDADLFGLANSIAAVVGGPVTIENASSRILAFSADQARGDDARKQSVLGHQVPGSYGRILTEQGIFREIYASDAPVFLPSIGPGVRPRVAMRIQAGDVLLGSIWVIVDEPIGAAQSAALVEAAAVASISLFRQRAATDAARRLRVSAVLDLLEGGARAKEAAGRLGFASAPATVLAVGLCEPESSPIDEEAALQRLADSLGTYLHSVHPLSVAAPVGGTVYAVLPHAVDEPGAGFARHVATVFAERFRRGHPIVIGLGGPVDDVAALQGARAEADRALRVLRSTWGSGSRLVADGGEVQVESLLLRLSDALAGEGERVTGPLAVLRSHDEAHGTSHVETLAAWLDAFGDVAQASAALHLHPNTFRYRLRRLAELAELDLGDPEVRFNLMLQLRLFGQRSG